MALVSKRLCVTKLSKYLCKKWSTQESKHMVATTVLRNKLQREMKKNQELINELETCQNENDELKQRFSLRKSKAN